MSNVIGQFKVSVDLAFTDYILWAHHRSRRIKLEKRAMEPRRQPLAFSRSCISCSWNAIGGDAASAWLTASREEGGRKGVVALTWNKPWRSIYVTATSSRQGLFRNDDSWIKSKSSEILWTQSVPKFCLVFTRKKASFFLNSSLVVELNIATITFWTRFNSIT